MARGFAGFRPADFSGTDDELTKRIERLNVEGRYILWTGAEYNARSQSLRSNSLRALKTRGVPVPLKEWIKLAARVVDDTRGYDPQAVRSGLYLHRLSKPTVYLELKKDDRGNYVSAQVHENVSWPGKETRVNYKPGDVVIAAEEAEAPAEVEATGSGAETKIVETPTSAARRHAARKGKAARR